MTGRSDFSRFEVTPDFERLGSADDPSPSAGRVMRRVLNDAEVSDRLRDEGLVLLSGLGRHASPDSWPGLFRLICSSLGSLLPQGSSRSAEVIREVRYRGGDLDDRTIRYSDSRSGGSYHTDGVPIPGPLPDVLGLLCVRPAARGGELVFIDSSTALTEAGRRMPSLMAVLGRDFHFDQRRTDVEATIIRRIVDTRGRHDLLVYLRDYIESGHRLPGVRPLTDEEHEAMDVLDEVLNDESLHIEGRLEPGQIALSDNHRFVHGRHGYSDDAFGDGRLMLRCWIRIAQR